MGAVTNAQVRRLAPYLVGERPKANGEWDMHCPLHEDRQRSASLNIDKGVWHCNAGCGGGSVEGLYSRRAEWRGISGPYSEAEAFSRVTDAKNNRHEAEASVINEEVVQGWVKLLRENPDQLARLASARGLTEETIHAYQIGMERPGIFTLPVRDLRGQVRNVRKYDITANGNGRRKIWSVSGYGTPWRLFPAPPHRDAADVVICEGEWDALVAIQHGFNAVSRTCGAGEPWLPEYNKFFEGKTVYVCFDMDEPGQAGNEIVFEGLKNITDVRIVRLPFKVTKDHGKDVSDYLLNTPYAAERFRNLLVGSGGGRSLINGPGSVDQNVSSPAKEKQSVRPLASVYSSERVGEPTETIVTVRGKREPGYSVPKRVDFTCSQDAGDKCDSCPMSQKGGHVVKDIPIDSGLNLDFLDVSRPVLLNTLRAINGIQKCDKLEIEVLEHRDVEILWARASVDHDDEGNLSAHRILSIGRNDTRPNTTVGIKGALFPSPKSQIKEFLAWEVDSVETDLDNFKIDRSVLKGLKTFRVSEGQSAFDKALEIADHHAEQVTKIFGRPELHVLMDLVYHSVLSFNFDGQEVDRGWLECLIVGDSRTGKSECGKRLAEFYRSGELVTCEGSSFAGLVGGVQQFGGKEWQVNWGTIPLNDRRLVILDEAGNLSHAEIAGMSSVRSSGVAEITKIQQDRTHARTRLVWIANPRDTRMQDYSYGVDTIRPLIGNNEDIARFDLAFSVREGDVDPIEMNRHHEGAPMVYSSDASYDLVRWAWSRTADQVLFVPGATQAVYDAAQDLGRRYTSDPPLIQVANARIKVARMAVAFAARTFSSDETNEVILVTQMHVKSAVDCLDWLYKNAGFGYAARSDKQINREEQSRKNIGAAREYMRNYPGLEEFLRDTPRFKRQDLEEMVTADRQTATGVIQKMSSLSMFRKDAGFVYVEPPLIEALRGDA